MTGTDGVRSNDRLGGEDPGAGSRHSARTKGASVDALPGTGLVRSIWPDCRYTVTLITDDVGRAVQDAGGWMADRVRAGWHVSVLVTTSAGTDPLRVLGASPKHIVSEEDWDTKIARPATLALGITVQALPAQLADRVRALTQDPTKEIILLGNTAVERSRRFTQVTHRLSPAARAFKACALRAASVAPASGGTEVFYSCAPWYPLEDGVDC